MLGLFLLGWAVVFIYYYAVSADVYTSLMSANTYIPALGGTAMLILAVIFKPGLSIFFYILFVVGVQFTWQEVVLPAARPIPNIYSAPLDAPVKDVEEEIGNMVVLPQKNGIIMSNHNSYFAFGVTAMQNKNAFIIKDAFFRNIIPQKPDLVLFAEYAKVQGNSIALYNAVNSESPTPKSYVLPLAFDMYTYFDISSDYQKIDLLDKFIDHPPEYRKSVALAIAQYFVCFIFLCVMGIISASYRNILKFRQAQWIGAIAFFVCSYPLVSLLYEYLLLITINIINYFV